MDSEVSLRPLSLKPGGGKANPFAGFGKGAGAGIKKQVTSPHAAPDWRHRTAMRGQPFRCMLRELCCSPHPCSSAQALQWLIYAAAFLLHRSTLSTFPAMKSGCMYVIMKALPALHCA